MSDGIQNIWCLVVDDALQPMDNVFRVKVVPKDNISALKEIILAKWKHFDLKAAANLSLWKLSDSFQVSTGPPAVIKSQLKELCLDQESGTEENSNAVRLNPSSIIKDEFSNPLPVGHVHLLIQLPPREDDIIDDRPSKRRKTVGEKLQSYFQTFPYQLPSQVGEPSVFLSEIQQSDPPKVHCNRPFELTNIPLALLHPVFGQFRDLAKTIKPSLEDNRTNLALIVMMLKHYSDDEDRQTAFHDFFLQYFSHQLHAGSPGGTESQTGGYGFADPDSSLPIIHIITAVKNELTGNSTDPYFQVTLLFKDYLKTFPKYIFSITIFPVMVVLVFGCYFQIAGMVVTANGIQIEILSPAFALFADPYDEDHRLMVTRCLAALRESLSTLRGYYKSLSESPLEDSTEDSTDSDDASFSSDDTSEDMIGVAPLLPSYGIPSRGYPSEGYPYVTSYKPFAEPNVASDFKLSMAPLSDKAAISSQT